MLVTAITTGFLIGLATFGSVATSQPTAAASPDTTVALPHSALRPFVGRYELGPAFVLTVWLDGGQLVTQATGQPPIRIYPQSETEFDVRLLGAKLTFERTTDGTVSGLVLRQGKDFRARKLGDSVPPLPKPVALPDEILDRYVGVYRFTPEITVTVARDGDHLTAQLTGEGPLPLRAYSETIFILDEPEALLRFSTTALGKVTGLSVAQDGRQRVGVKIG